MIPVVKVDNSKNISNRDFTLDMMKGIGILSVIIGHLSNYMTQFIFSFHMPLFFILGGYLYKHKSPSDLLKRDYKHLIIPYLFTASIVLLYWALLDMYEQNFNNIWNRILTVLYGNGSPNHTSALLSEIPVIGAIWFLLAMFWCKQVFNYLYAKINVKYLGLTCGGISILAIILDTICINLPFSILPGLGALIFYYIGYLIKRHGGFDSISKILIIIFALFWVYSVMFCKMSMVRCFYSNIIVNFCGAICACIVIFLLCKYLSKFRFRKKCIKGGVCNIGGG